MTDTILVVSPHLDDAVLSVGGTIAARSADGARVVVVTIFAGDPPPTILSSFAWAFHTTCGLSHANAVAARRTEDLRAVRELGASAVHLPFLDAVYRRTGRRALVESEADLFQGVVQPSLVAAVGGVLRRICRAYAATHLIAPRAVGGHIDHRVAHAASCTAGCQAFFEDLPYAARSDEAAPEQSATVSPIAPEMWRRKCEAVRAYTSQHSAIATSAAALEAELEAHARRVGGGVTAERLWLTDSRR